MALVCPFLAANLESAVRTGESPRTLSESCDEEPGRWDLAHRGFRAVASLLVDDVFDAAPYQQGRPVRVRRRRPGAGGRIAVLDQLEGSARTSVGEAGLWFVDLTDHVTLGASTHPPEPVETWLREAGFEDVEQTSFRTAPGTVPVEATRA